MGELKWFLLFFIGLYIIWLLAGGPSAQDKDNQFLHQPAPVENGQTYNFEEYKAQNPGVFKNN
jgi:hypothetical protein